MTGDPEELPELVRIFFFGSTDNPSGCYEGSSCERTSFDYVSATNYLKENPEQVEYVAYECQTTTRRNRSGSESLEKNTARDDHTTSIATNKGGDVNRESSRNMFTHTNAFLHSPLRWACIETEATKEAEAMEFLQTIRTINPTVFLIQDRHGDLPIDGECVLNASPEFLSFLLDIYLEYDFECLNGVSMIENNFNLITCLCGSFWWEDIRKAHDDIVSGRYVVSGRNVFEDNLGIEENFWKKIILLTKAFYHKTTKDIRGDDNGNRKENHQGNVLLSPSKLRITNKYVDRTVEFRLLHACAGIDWFPPNLLKLLVAAFPAALLERDEDENLPIHVAAGSMFESYKMYDYQDYDSWPRDFEANSGYQKTTIDIFLRSNPHLARIRDGTGRLPLELALDNDLGKLSQYEKLHRRLRPWEDGGIGSLFEAYPGAAKIRNPVTKNLPLEITLSSGSIRDWDDGIEVLLRAYPEAASLKNPKTGKYLLQLAIERDTHFDDGIYGLLEASPKTALSCMHAARVVPPKPRTFRRSFGGRPSFGRVIAPDYSTALRRMVSPPPPLPLFAHAALERCSTSVVYKLLRMNPQTGRKDSEPSRRSTKKIRDKRKRRGDDDDVGMPIMDSFCTTHRCEAAIHRKSVRNKRRTESSFGVAASHMS